MPPILDDKDVGIIAGLSDKEVGIETLSDEDVGIGATEPSYLSTDIAPKENVALRAEQAALRAKDEGGTAVKVLTEAETAASVLENPLGAVLALPENTLKAAGVNMPYSSKAPLVTKEQALKAIEFITPGGGGSEGTLTQSVQEFIAETLSTLTSPDMIGYMMAAKKAPVPVGRYFQGEMLAQLPATAAAAAETESGSEKTKAALAVAANVAFPAMIESGIGKHSTAIKGEVAKQVGPATEAAVKGTTEASKAAAAVESTQAPVERTTALEAVPAEIEAPKPVVQPEAKPVGLGAATPAEFELKPQNPTSIKNAVVDQERASRGLPPAMEPASKEFGVSWEQAMAKMDADYAYPDRLIAEMRANPRAATDTEVATLLHRQVELRNLQDKAMRELAQAKDDGRLEDVAELNVRVDILSNQLLDLFNIDKAVGTENARGLNARKMLAYEDFTLAKMELEKRAAKGGEQLTDAERAEVVRVNREIEETQRKHDEHVVAVEETARTAATDKAISNVKSSGPPTEPVEAITAQLKEKFAAGEADAMTSLVQKLARHFVEKGIKERDPLIAAVHDVVKNIDPTLELRDTMDMISGYGKYRQLSKDEVSKQLRDLKGQMQQVGKLEDIQARKPPLKTGVERREPSTEERRLIKLVNDAKRRFGIVVTDPATQLRSALEARKTYYRNQIADLEAQITAKEKFVKDKAASPTDAELDGLKARSSALKEEFDAIFGKPGLSDAQRLEAMNKRAAELEAKIAAGDIATKPSSVNRPLSPELEQAKQRVEALNRRLAELRKKPEAQKAAERVAKAIEALNKRIAEKEARIAAGDISVRSQRLNRPALPGLEVAKQRLDALNKQIAELREAAKPKLSEEQAALKALKTRLQKSIDKFEDKLARKDFTTTPKRVIQLDAEAQRLHFKAAQTKAKWHEALMKDRLARRTVPQKILGGVGEVLNTTRAILTSLDLSAVLRQGGFITLGHPVRALKAFSAMFRALRSQAGQHAVNQEIMARKNYPLYQQSKLYLAEHGQKLSQMEEAYMSRWADTPIRIKGVDINPVAASQRAYVTFLNKLRADSFDVMANTLSRTGEVAPHEAKAIANFINVATGRGKLGVKDNAAVGLSTVFFAPRYVASRFQLIAGQPFYKGSARTRTAVAKEYARFLIGAAVVYGLGALAGGEVETDPRSSDFGKLRFDDTRLDPMAGLLQSTVLLSRLGSGETTRLSGKTVPIRGDQVPFGGDDAADVTARFLRTKLSPVIGTTVNVLSGTDVTGEKITPEKIGEDLLVPLALKDILKAMEDQGVPRGTALAILSIFGMGLQTYER